MRSSRLRLSGRSRRTVSASDSLVVRAITGFIFMALNRKLDEMVDQLGIGNARCGPQAGIHAHRREPGDRVDFVEVQRAVGPIEEEIDPGHTGGIYRVERTHGKVLD